MASIAGPLANHRPLTRKERQQQTREAVLSAARKVVVQRGIAGATHVEIAKEAGVTTGAIYSNFESKADLMVAVLEEAASSGVMLRADCANLRECLEDLAHRLTAQADSQPEMTVLSVEFVLAAIRDPEFRERRLPQRDAEHERYARTLEDIAARSGERLPMPADKLVEVVANLGWALMCSRAMLGSDVITESFIVDALTSCLGTNA